MIKHLQSQETQKEKLQTLTKDPQSNHCLKPLKITVEKQSKEGTIKLRLNRELREKIRIDRVQNITQMFKRNEMQRNTLY